MPTDETYPTPIKVFDAWWAAKCRAAIEADDDDLKIIMSQVEAYAKPGWILKDRPDELRRIVAKARRDRRQSP